MKTSYIYNLPICPPIVIPDNGVMPFGTITPITGISESSELCIDGKNKSELNRYIPTQVDPPTTLDNMINELESISEKTSTSPDDIVFVIRLPEEGTEVFDFYSKNPSDNTKTIHITHGNISDVNYKSIILSKKQIQDMGAVKGTLEIPYIKIDRDDKTININSYKFTSNVYYNSNYGTATLDKVKKVLTITYENPKTIFEDPDIVECVEYEP